MADKQTRLSIVIRTVDQATAAIRAIGARISRLTAPIRALAGTGVSKLVDGLRAVGGAVGSLLRSIPVLGGVIAATVGGAVFALKKMIDGFDDLGDRAEAMGVDVDFLAQMRFAAEKSGASVEQLDGGLKAFSKSLGEARAGTGRMAAFIGKVSPALLKQLKGAKSNAEAFDLLAGAMAKLEDPAKRAAFAQKTLGDASLAPLLNRGAQGIKELREEHFKYAGSLKQAAEESGKVDDAMKNLKASTDGIEAAIVVGLAPALKIVVDRLREWFVDNRENIAKWAKDLGEKLPGAIRSVVTWVESAIGKLQGFFDTLSKIADLADDLTGGDRRERKQAAKAADALRAQAANMSPEQQQRFGQQLMSEGADMYSQIDGASKSRSVWLNAMSEAYREAGSEIRQKGITGGDMWGAGVRRGSEDAPANITTEQAGAILAGDLKYEIANVLKRVNTSAQAKVTIEFKNAPPTMRPSVDPGSTADVDYSVGTNMIPGLP